MSFLVLSYRNRFNFDGCAELHPEIRSDSREMPTFSKLLFYSPITVGHYVCCGSKAQMRSARRLLLSRCVLLAERSKADDRYGHRDSFCVKVMIGVSLIATKHEHISRIRYLQARLTLLKNRNYLLFRISLAFHLRTSPRSEYRENPQSAWTGLRGEGQVFIAQCDRIQPLTQQTLTVVITTCLPAWIR